MRSTIRNIFDTKLKPMPCITSKKEDSSKFLSWNFLLIIKTSCPWDLFRFIYLDILFHSINICWALWLSVNNQRMPVFKLRKKYSSSN